MEKGIKKAATVLAAAALLSACGSAKIQTHEVTQDELVAVLERAFGAGTTSGAIDTFAGVACKTIRDEGKEGAETVRSLIYDATQNPDDAVDAVSGIILNYCPDLAK